MSVPFAYGWLGPVIVSEGATVSTMKVVDGEVAGEGLPASSTAAPAAIVMPRMPLPLKPESVTVGFHVSPSVTTIEPAFGLPAVLFWETLPEVREYVLAPVMVTLKASLPEALTCVPLGAPIETEGGVVSTLNVAEGSAAGAVFPAASLAVPAATEIPMVPSPVRPDRETVLEAFPLPAIVTVVALAPPVLFSVTAPRVMLLAPV